MPSGQKPPTFIETARRAQIIECAIETIATLGYVQASLAQIAKCAGISKSVITYYFHSKNELIEEIVKAILTDAAHFIWSRIRAQPTATLMLQTYIQAHVEYISAHLPQMIAYIEIVVNFLTKKGQRRHDPSAEEPVLAALENILRKGQEEGEFREFNLRVMALAIRRTIDQLSPLLRADPNFDADAYRRELVTLFERATRKD